jgi:NAD(P)-dependent dehydrogenase (short-subunit alcohol dehydrogenase family)
MKTGLKNKVALVTGGSSGIGAAAAEAFGREGARVAITYNSGRERAAQVADRVERSGGEAITVSLALDNERSIGAAVDAVVERWDGIDVLVAGAVRWPDARAEQGRAEALPLENWRQSLRTNVEGTVATVNAALPAMRGRGWGRIVLISSSVAEEGLPGPNPYGVGKSALYGLGRQLAWDVGRDGILVNTIATGFTVTERNLEHFDDAVRESVSARIPSRRLSGPEEVASLIVFLCSEANGNITGEVIHEGSATGRATWVA